MKKQVSLILTAALTLTAVSGVSASGDMTAAKTNLTNNVNRVYASAQWIYDNITAEVIQIKSFISKGLYLEAIRDCKQTKAWHKLSQEDINLLNSLQNEAANKYQSYLNRQPQWYRISGWAMNYKFEKNCEPEMVYGDYGSGYGVRVYDGDDGYIDIYSLYVGDQVYWEGTYTIYNAHQYVSAYGQMAKKYYCDDSIDAVEILSESQTTVGSLPAWQVTARASTFLDRYGYSCSYFIDRCTAFQFGNWIYAIVATKYDYSWGADFWNKMEMLRTSIYFG
jgi:hypothetical protein